MTKKHFKAIAEIIKKQNEKCPQATGNCIAYELCDYFKSVNSKFDSQRFLNACGINLYQVT